ncbi:MFS transporter [Streptomyces sp. NPDC052496]|uniref:MFS transporter n=1 Tax=Streptomyces sp. NPDC052496 TaxID=3154951 RepID=UPI00341D27F7
MTHRSPSASPAPAGAPAVPPRSAPAFWTVAYLLFAVMLGGALPTPLYPRYAADLGLSPLLIALVFAMYAVGILATLLLLGGLSDKAGRRRVLAPALAVAALSCLVFILFPTLPGLIAGRFLSGVSVGLATGAATAYLRELSPDPARAALVASATNMFGLGGGPLLSGVLARYAAWPLVVPYLALALCLLPGFLLARLPETVRRGGGRLRVQRLAVPPTSRPVFLAMGPAIFAAFALLGLLAALTGTFLKDVMHQHSPLLVGVLVCAAFSAAGLTQLAIRRFSLYAGALGGMVVVPLGLVLIVAALPTESLWLFLLGAVVGGAGAGAAFRSGVALVSGSAPASLAGQAVSSLFVAAYLGLTVPVIGVGVLAAASSLFVAAVVFAVLVGVLTAASTVATLRFRRKQAAPPTAAPPHDRNGVAAAGRTD